MKNTIENKAKFFAQHWGQEVVKWNERSSCRKLTVKDVTDYELQYNWLELKPLSQITDEDAIEVAKIITDELETTEYRFNIKERGFGDMHTSVLPVLVEWNCKHPSVMRWLWAALVQIDTEDNDIIIGRYVNDGKELEDEPADNILHAYDLLRSKGYALPYMGISVEQQIEWGWVKLVNSK